MGEDTYTYDRDALKSGLAKIIQKQLSPESWNWLEEKVSLLEKNSGMQNLALAFAGMSRKTGKKVATQSEEEVHEVSNMPPGLRIASWSIDRLCRVWLLMHLDAADKEQYFRTIETLFLTAEMQEQVALYSALPVLAYPKLWRGRCAEGIRSNIGDVLESIMIDNPYPSLYLDEPAWNQLVLKAIFTEKPVHKIIGLDARANQRLADTLSDYAHERWAAHRSVNPMLWRCVGKFINEKIFSDIERIAFSENTAEQEAAALACKQSGYKPAHDLLQGNNQLKSIVESGITWEQLASKLEQHPEMKG